MQYLIKNARYVTKLVGCSLWVYALIWGVVYPDLTHGEALNTDIIHEGVHWECMTDRGAVHVWAPFHYQRESAGVVVFVHGYSVNVDEAWANLGLAEQFQMSKRNAVFIVPEAPSDQSEAVTWPTLGSLRQAIRQCGLYLPSGYWTVIGHSGAYRTLQSWVDDREVRHFILLDALYARHKRFKRFLERRNTKMTLVSTETSETSREFSEQFSYVVKRPKIPSHFREFTPRERRSRLLYLKSQYNHWTLVTNKKVIPMTLRLTKLHPVYINQSRRGE